MWISHLPTLSEQQYATISRWNTRVRIIRFRMRILSRGIGERGLSHFQCDREADASLLKPPGGEDRPEEIQLNARYAHLGPGAV